MDINGLCKALHETYNTNYLNTIPVEMQKIFSDMVKKNVDTKKGNKTLIKLIYNNFFNTKPMYKTISGPMSFYHLYSPKYQKIIYMFGEYHGRDNSCELDRYDITQYLSELFETTNVFIDFFIEVPIISNKKHYYNKDTLLIRDSYINDLFLEFIDCIEPENRQQNKCSLSRVHYIDIRNINYKENPSFNTNIFGFFIYNTQSFDELPDVIIEMLEFFQTNSTNNVVDYILSQYTKNTFLTKEIKKSYMNNEISIFFYRKIKKYIKDNLPQIKQAINYLSQIQIKSNLKSALSILDYLKQEFTHINHYLIDWYTLSRIYKKVNNKDNQQYEPSEPKNIIIYAGNNHIQNYLEFFQSQDYILVESQIQKNKNKIRCLDMQNIKQPLFNKTIKEYN